MRHRLGFFSLSWSGALLAAAALAAAAAAATNPKQIPLGDGNVGSTPTVGSIDSCQTSFNANAGGAQVVGPWIDQNAKTWDETAKIAVAGSVSWPAASYSATVSGTTRDVTTNDLPVDHTSGTFPVGSTDPAHQYDANPNHIAEQNYSLALPADPTAAALPTCLGMGVVGVLKDGVVLYDGLDGEGRDAGAHEVLDSCAGHPDEGSIYHHHDVPPCILDAIPNGTTELVGYALDGYGIYVVKDANGNLPTNADLDACHGTTSAVPWDGRQTTIYHYVATLEYPYTLGCYHGTPISLATSGGGGSKGSGSGGGKGGSKGSGKHGAGKAKGSPGGRPGKGGGAGGPGGGGKPGGSGRTGPGSGGGASGSGKPGGPPPGGGKPGGPPPGGGSGGGGGQGPPPP